MSKKDYIWNPTTCRYKTGKYLASTMDDSVITRDEIIETTKTIPTKTVLTKSTSTYLVLFGGEKYDFI